MVGNRKIPIAPIVDGESRGDVSDGGRRPGDTAGAAGGTGHRGTHTDATEGDLICSTE